MKVGGMIIISTSWRNYSMTDKEMKLERFKEENKNRVKYIKINP